MRKVSFAHLVSLWLEDIAPERRLAIYERLFELAGASGPVPGVRIPGYEPATYEIALSAASVRLLVVMFPGRLHVLAIIDL